MNSTYLRHTPACEQQDITICNTLDSNFWTWSWYSKKFEYQILSYIHSRISHRYLTDISQILHKYPPKYTNTMEAVRYPEFERVAEAATIPTRATSGSAGYDLYALEARTVVGGEGSVLVPTGIAVRIPPGHYARIAPRSGLALKQHLAVNAGVVDADYYRNAVGVILYCTRNGHSYTVAAGERFAQIIIEAIAPPIPAELEACNCTATSEPAGVTSHAGFGSTGK